MDAYAVDKLLSHPSLFAQYATGGVGRLLTVHLMPQNACNQRCAFCSYRMGGNKNATAFDEAQHLEFSEMRDAFRQFRELGVQGVEVTGGGEPLAHPAAREMWAEMAAYPFSTALVTNGTLLRDLAPVVCNSGLKWARVSIDASTPEMYSAIRQCPSSHFGKAWDAVANLRQHAPADPDFRLGVGFVACRDNLSGVYDFVRMARDGGADNVRLSCTYSHHGADYFAGLEEALERAQRDAAKAEDDFHAPGEFEVHNLLTVRAWENEHPTQDYPRCPTAQFLCVLEGSGNVYTCCSFAGSKKGLLGNVRDHDDGFRGVWNDSAPFRQSLDPSAYCHIPCLYRARNLSVLRAASPKLHKEFI